MLEMQKNQLQEHMERIEQRYALRLKDSNNEILNLKRIEKTLAKQKKYIKAQKTREEWQKKQEELAIMQREEIEQKKKDAIDKFAKRNKDEIDEFVKRINQMRINLENQRQQQLDKLILKYERLKKQLSSLQSSESKRIKNFKNFKVTDINDTMINDSHSMIAKNNISKSAIDFKKKVIMKKIKRLNNKGY